MAKWMADAMSKPSSHGALHRALGVPEGDKIGASRIESATHSDNPRIRRMASLAKTFSRFRRGGR